jgi:hypothetical protein
MAKRDPVMSSNSNDTIGECANPLLDDTRWLVSRYTCCNVPTVSVSPVAARDIRRVGQPPADLWRKAAEEADAQRVNYERLYQQLLGELSALASDGTLSVAEFSRS